MNPSSFRTCGNWLIGGGLLILLSLGCSAEKQDVDAIGSSPRRNVSQNTPETSGESSQPLILLSETVAPIRYADTYQSDTPITATNAHQVRELVTIGKGVLQDILWSRDGQTLVAIGSESIYVFDATNFAAPPRIFLNALNPLAISGDGRLLAARTSETPLVVWDAHSGEVLATPILPDNTQFFSFAFNPSDNELAALDSVDNVYRWSISGGQTLHLGDGHIQINHASRIAYHPNGHLFAVGIHDSEVMLTNVDGNETVLTVQVPDWYRWFEVSADGSTMILPVADQWDTRGRTLSAYQLFDTASGAEAGEVPADNFASTLNPITDTYLTINQGTLEIHDIPTQRILDQFYLATVLRELDNKTQHLDPHVPFIPLSTRQLDLKTTDFSPDGQHIALSYQSGEIIILHVNSGETFSIVGAFSGPYYDAWLTSDNHTVVTATAHSVDLWDLATGIGEFGVPRDSGSGLGLLPDGIAFAVGETSIMLYDVQTLIPRRPLRSSGRADVISFDANGTHLAWMTDRNGTPRLHIRNLVDETIPIARIPLEAAQGFVPMMVFSPTGDTIAAVHGNGNLTVWEIDTISPLVQLPLPDTNYQRLTYAPDGKSIAFSAGSLPIRVINIDTGTDSILADTGYFVLGLEYSPDGTVLAANGVESVLLFDASSGAILATLDDLDPYVEHIRFSVDGNYLISAGSDGTVRLWGIPLEH